MGFSQFLHPIDTTQNIQWENWSVDDTKYQFNIFRKHVVQTTSCRPFRLFTPNSLRALQQHVNPVRTDEIVTKNGRTCRQSYFLNSGCRHFHSTGVVEIVKRSMDAIAMVYSSECTQKSSAVACVHLSSDTSKVFLARGSLQFYPLHTTLLNIGKE